MRNVIFALLYILVFLSVSACRTTTDEIHVGNTPGEETEQELSDNNENHKPTDTENDSDDINGSDSLSDFNFLETIINTFLHDYEEITILQWTDNNNETLKTPAYLPERFIQYDGVFINENLDIPDMLVSAQLWYDPILQEVLIVSLVPCNI